MKLYVGGYFLPFTCILLIVKIVPLQGILELEVSNAIHIPFLVGRTMGGVRVWSTSNESPKVMEAEDTETTTTKTPKVHQLYSVVPLKPNKKSSEISITSTTPVDKNENVDVATERFFSETKQQYLDNLSTESQGLDEIVTRTTVRNKQDHEKEIGREILFQTESSSTNSTAIKDQNVTILEFLEILSKSMIQLNNLTESSVNLQMESSSTDSTVQKDQNNKILEYSEISPESTIQLNNLTESSVHLLTESSSTDSTVQKDKILEFSEISPDSMIQLNNLTESSVNLQTESSSIDSTVQEDQNNKIVEFFETSPESMIQLNNLTESSVHLLTEISSTDSTVQKDKILEFSEISPDSMIQLNNLTESSVNLQTESSSIDSTVQEDQNNKIVEFFETSPESMIQLNNLTESSVNLQTESSSIDSTVQEDQNNIILEFSEISPNSMIQLNNLTESSVNLQTKSLSTDSTVKKDQNNTILEFLESSVKLQTESSSTDSTVEHDQINKIFEWLERSPETIIQSNKITKSSVNLQTESSSTDSTVRNDQNNNTLEFFEISPETIIQLNKITKSSVNLQTESSTTDSTVQNDQSNKILNFFETSPETIIRSNKKTNSSLKYSKSWNVKVGTKHNQRTIKVERLNKTVIPDNRLGMNNIVENISNTKYILQWSHGCYKPFEINMQAGRKIFTSRNCAFTNCIITNNKNFLDDYTKFNAVVFFAKDLLMYQTSIGRTYLPSRRNRHQKYVFASYDFTLRLHYPASFSNFIGFFNWTWTYRLDSDLTWTHFVFKDMNGNVVAPSQNVSWIKQKDMLPVPDKLRTIIMGKWKAVAWFDSCTASASRTYPIISRLSKRLQSRYGITVHRFGKYWKHDCNAEVNKDKCNEMLRKEYYFYLAFEEQICEDFVSDTVLRAFNNSVVPIVLGGADYTRFLPEGSYVDASIDDSITLADKIHQLLNDFNRYADHFQWTNHYTFHRVTEDPQTDHLCKVCEMLSDEKKLKEETINYDFGSWWGIYQHVGIQDETTITTTNKPITKEPYAYSVTQFFNQAKIVLSAPFKTFLKKIKGAWKTITTW